MSPEAFIQKYEKALAAQQWERVEPLIHENCVAIFSSGTYKGKEAVERAFRANFDSIKDEKYAISNVHWIVKSEQFSVVTYDFNWAGLIDGKSASGSGRGTSTLVNSDGVWTLIAEHLGPSV